MPDRHDRPVGEVSGGSNSERTVRDGRSFRAVSFSEGRARWERTASDLRLFRSSKFSAGLGLVEEHSPG